MKRLALPLLMIFLIPAALMAEMPPVEITPVFGYHIAGGTGTDEGHIDISDSMDSSVSDAWFFALDLKGGVKFYLNDRPGFRLQGRFLMPMNFYDTGFFLGIGPGGSSGGVTYSGTAFIYQGDFSIGLIIRL